MALNNMHAEGVLPWIDWNTAWPIALSAVLLISMTTRFLSGAFGASKPMQDGAKTVPLIPYWLPILGHIPQFVFRPESLLNKARDAHKGGLFALNLGASTHNIVFSPSLGSSLMNQKNTVADIDSVAKHIMVAVFGFPKSALKKYDAAYSDLTACYKHLLSEPSLGDMVQRTIDVTKGNIANLVTFSTSIVDQMEWERSSGAETIVKPNGERVVETSMLPLVRDFIAHNANPALIGTDFVNNNPQFFQDLWAVDSGFKWLATGIPRWVPLPPLLHAHIARRKAFSAIREWEEAMEKTANGQDPGQEWQYLDDVSPILKQRLEVYRKHDLSMSDRSALELSLLWAMNANANALVFWMLNHIYADPVLLALLREEIAPHVQVYKPKQVFGVAEPPRIGEFSADALATKCPLLKSCYIESLRLDAAPWSFRVMNQDLVLSSARDKTAEKFLLKKGTYAHIAHSIHHTDPAYFDDPRVWKADRHVKYGEKNEETGESTATAEMGTIRPYGGGHGMCKGRAFAQKEALVFTAAFISIWDMEAVGGGPWKMPRYKTATGVYTTCDSTKVWIKQRSDISVAEA